MGAMHGLETKTIIKKKKAERAQRQAEREAVAAMQAERHAFDKTEAVRVWRMLKEEYDRVGVPFTATLSDVWAQYAPHREAARTAAEQAHAAALAQEAITLDTMLSLWARWEVLDGPALWYRVQKLAERQERDRRTWDVRWARHTRQSGVQIQYVTESRTSQPWTEAESKWLAKQKGPARDKVQPKGSRTVEDIYYYARSRTGEGTICDPVYVRVQMWFTPDKGKGVAYKVTSHIDTVDKSTPIQVVAWLGDQITKIENGFVLELETVERRHGGNPLERKDHIAGDPQPKAHMARPSARPERVKQHLRYDPNSNVGDMKMPRHRD